MLDVEGFEVENSPAVDLVGHLVSTLGEEGALREIDRLFGGLTNTEGAALAYDWEFWARPKQLLAGDWELCLFLTGRGFGKTYGISRWVNGEVEAGRARSIGLAAQDESNTVALQVAGPSGLIATAPPWFRPEWVASELQLVWPNGARAYVRTPEVPGKVRGFDYDLAWLSELQSWPVATREEAFSNFRLATRVGLARTLCDATPKRRHPMLRSLLEQCARDPIRNRAIRGTTYENAIHLAKGYIEKMADLYGGTMKGREELLGEMLDESEASLFRQDWIDKARRALPVSGFTRAAIGVDPAVSSRRGSDQTGIIKGALGHDGQAYVLRNMTGKHQAHEWAAIVLDEWESDRTVDVVVVETNRGGNLVTSNLRAAAEGRGLRVVEIGRHERPRRVDGVVTVKPVHSEGAKDERAAPVATAYERGRVSHVLGADLSTLEDTLTTWEPPVVGTRNVNSPDDLDALTFVVTELLGLTSSEVDARKDMAGIAQAQAKLEAVAKGARVGGMSLDQYLRGVGRGNGGRI